MAGIEEFGEIVPFDRYEPKMFCIARVGNSDGNASRVVGRIDFGYTVNELIQDLSEYWSDVDEPPEWRKR